MYKVNIEKCGSQEIELYELFSDLFHKYENGISVKNDEEASEMVDRCYDMYHGYGGE